MRTALKIYDESQNVKNLTLTRHSRLYYFAKNNIKHMILSILKIFLIITSYILCTCLLFYGGSYYFTSNFETRFLTSFIQSSMLYFVLYIVISEIRISKKNKKRKEYNEYNYFDKNNEY